MGYQQKGFCEHVSFSEEGEYIYAMYSTGDGFRVFDAGTLTEISTLTENFDMKRSLATMPIINDMAVEHDRLYVSTDGELYVFAITDGGLQLLHTECAGLLQAFKAVTVMNDTIYTSVVNMGLVRYTLDSTGSDFSLKEDALTTPECSNPEFLAVDDYGLYLGYRKYGIYSLSKTTLEQSGCYRTGLGLNGAFGLQDLFRRDGYIFAVEYHAQTTILTNNDSFVRINVHRDAATAPASPVRGFMEGRTEECMTSRMELSVTDRESRSEILRNTGRNTAVEVAGNIKEIVQ